MLLSRVADYFQLFRGGFYFTGQETCRVAIQLYFRILTVSININLIAIRKLDIFFLVDFFAAVNIIDDPEKFKKIKIFYT